MAPHSHRPSLSITLPPSFTFNYTDGQLPKTPEGCDNQQTPLEPPEPPRPGFKIRRKRATIPDFLPLSDALPSNDTLSSTPIPSIEMSEAVSELSSPVFRPTMSDDAFLAPLPSISRFITPPKTPAPKAPANLASPLDFSASEWSLITDSRDKLQPGFERSNSVCSSFSDSSVSSAGSSAFSAPNACASPESEVTDPFVEDEFTSKFSDKAAFRPKQEQTPSAKRVKTHRTVRWTQAMDDHLWMTFCQYLADPRVTPFKMLPGTPPPLGVCSRVASKAKRTWSAHRAASVSGMDTLMASDNQREGSPDTIRPDVREAASSQWPRGDGATRKRLRVLVKRRPSLAAHYQRLLRTRTPSPFPSSGDTSASRASEPPSAAFSSRDLNVSLTTATAPSMQPEGPLAQLASEDEPRPEVTKRTSRPADWYARIPRSQAHQKSLSLQSGLNLNMAAFRPTATLASPFDDDLNRFHMLQSMAATKSLGRTDFKDGKVPTLDSPVELSGAPTLPRSLKRRFRSDEEKPRRGALEDVFGPSGSEEVVVRNRGFTVGAVRATDSLAKLFSPPVQTPLPAPPAPPAPSVDHDMLEAPSMSEASELGPPGSRSAPRRLVEPIPRLGSPFVEAASNRPFNTFPRRFIPTAADPQPFQSALRRLQKGDDVLT